MKAGKLQQVVADAMLVDSKIVWRTMRYLREGGMLTTGARGVNAPDMTYLDAARLIIAQIVEHNPGLAAPDKVARYGRLRLSNPAIFDDAGPFSLNALLPDAPLKTFEGAVAALIRAFAECRDTEAFKAAGTTDRAGNWRKPSCFVRIDKVDDGGLVSMADADCQNAYAYGAGFYPASEWHPQHDYRVRLGRTESAEINQEVIAAVADGFREGQT